MKQGKWALILLLGCLSTCVKADEFRFVSVLSAPVASFDQVETKGCDATKPQGVFNMGSEASSKGTINVSGGPIDVGSLKMENGTKITATNDISWLVNTLNVGQNGTVTVKKLFANTVTLLNNPNATSGDDALTTTLNATNLEVNRETWSKDGAATNLLVNIASDAKFDFRESGAEGSEARWIQIPAGTGETDVQADTYYPITTAPN